MRTPSTCHEISQLRFSVATPVERLACGAFVSTLLKGATLVEIEPPSVESADVRIERGKITARAPTLEALPGEEVTDLSGRYVLPGFVSAHHHLHASLLRGHPRASSGFVEEQDLFARLERALAADDIRAAAAFGSLEGLNAGTTTIFALHASPRIEGGLGHVAAGIAEVGLRSVLAMEISELEGPAARDLMLAESVSFLERSRGRQRAAVGLTHVSKTPDAVLAAVRALAQQHDVFTLLNVAEDPREEAQSLATFGANALERLFAADLITEKTVVSQAVHFSWPQLSDLLGRGAWLAHAARGNMNTQAGLATSAKFGVRACLATDVMSLDVFAEAQAAALRSRDAGQPIDLLRFIANGHRLASQVFGQTIGPLRAGAVADLVVLDAQPGTPLTAETLAAHLLHGLSAQHVESVMVDGLWRLWKHKPLSVDALTVAQACRAAASAVWDRIPTA